jgi:hypothetical protein
LPLEGIVILVFVTINIMCVARENNLMYGEIQQRICNLLENLKGLLSL